MSTFKKPRKPHRKKRPNPARRFRRPKPAEPPDADAPELRHPGEILSTALVSVMLQILPRYLPPPQLPLDPFHCAHCRLIVQLLRVAPAGTRTECPQCRRPMNPGMPPPAPLKSADIIIDVESEDVTYTRLPPPGEGKKK